MLGTEAYLIEMYKSLLYAKDINNKIQPLGKGEHPDMSLRWNLVCWKKLPGRI